MTTFSDTERLDFMLMRAAYIQLWTSRETSEATYQVVMQDGDEAVWVLSGADSFFPTQRGAIDAAIKREQENKPPELFN